MSGKSELQKVWKRISDPEFRALGEHYGDWAERMIRSCQNVY